MSALAAVLLFLLVGLLGLVAGGLIERYRWLRWARRAHPDEVDTTLL